MFSKNCILLLFGVLLGSSLFAQDVKALKDRGEQLFWQKHYEKAIQNFEAYQKIIPADPEASYLLGVCYYLNHELPKAETALSNLLETVKEPFENLYFYLAKVHHSGNKFEKAVHFYKQFLRKAAEDDLRRNSVKDDIKRCGIGLKVGTDSIKVLVENLGMDINSKNDEFAPLQSPNYENKLYFSATRNEPMEPHTRHVEVDNKTSNMYLAEVKDGKWGKVENMGYLLNSFQNEVLLGFSNDGSRLYFFRGQSTYSGDIYVDTFRQEIEESVLVNTLFESPMNPWEGDVSPYFFDDNNIVFSSRRAGGFGGLDLFITTFQNGEWTKPQNLGAAINTPYDETAPFLAKDGRTLYYSTNHPHRSIGGLDICKTKYDDQTEKWSIPVNLKFPINSAEDEAHFRITKDGKKAYFSSFRKTGYGARDIYVANYKVAQMENLLASEPAVFHEVPEFKKEVKSNDFLAREESEQNTDLPEKFVKQYTITSFFYDENEAALSEKDLAQLNKLISLVKEFPQIKILLTAHSDNFLKERALYASIKKTEPLVDYLIKNDIPASNIYCKGLGAGYPIALNEINGTPNPGGQSLNRRIDIFLANTSNLPLDIKYERPEVDDFMIADGFNYYQSATKGLSYKVQIASSQEAYNGELFSKYPNAMVEGNMASAFYEYTIGLYQTYQSAEFLKDDLERQGVLEAKVIAYVNGVRVTRKEAQRLVSVYPDLENYIND